MEHQVALYLFSRKYCVLPAIGTLKIEEHPARYIGTDQQIQPPVPYISFSVSSEESDLTEYIAATNDISMMSATAYIQEFCEKIKALKKEESVRIPSAGSFAVDEQGRLHFLSEPADPAFLPLVEAKTVLRTADHAILVGDIESNATQMTAYYSETSESKRAVWKIFAIILFIIAAGWIAYNLFYLKNGIGNSSEIKAGSPASTYNVSQPAK